MNQIELLELPKDLVRGVFHSHIICFLITCIKAEFCAIIRACSFDPQKWGHEILESILTSMKKCFGKHGQLHAIFSIEISCQTLNVRRRAIEYRGKYFLKLDGSLSVELLIFPVVIDVFLNIVDKLCKAFV